MKKIMLVDDFASIRLATSFPLKFAGYEIVEAANGEDALRQLEIHKVDLIITDIHMPVMDGLELMRKVRQHKFYRYLPMIASSTQAREIDAKHAGATVFIQKPFEFHGLLDIVRRLIR